jgi:regulator of chromosome condensation
MKPQKPKQRPFSALSPVPEAKPSKEPKPPLNDVPQPPEKTRPCLQLFVWGAGNFGQFGLGPDVLGEISKPKKSAWVDEQIQKHVFGDNFGGLEAIAAGGMHTILIDERGTVCTIFPLRYRYFLSHFQVWTCGVNDDAALGRITKEVPDPENPDAFLDVDELTSVPHPLQSLIDENFRAVRIAAGDSISAAISSEGELRVWGSFRVRCMPI